MDKNLGDVLIATPLPITEAIISADVKLPPSCPWSKVKVVESVSLNDVMSEQLAKSLVEADTFVPMVEVPNIVDDFIGCGEVVTDCTDDYLLAKMMQLEFDKEHDQILKKEESKYNGNSKVKISFGKYRRVTEESFSSDDEEDKDEILDQSAREHWLHFEQNEKTFQALGKSGVSRQGNVTTTKHDPTVCGRRNAGKLMQFPPGISTGDGGGFDMKISNNVFNTLKTFSKAENKRGQRLHEKKERSTAEKALDEKTHLILYKLVNNQTLDSVTGCISTGKEANVYHAWSGLPEEESPSPEFALKVYKTTLNEFQNRDQYIKDDYRFRQRFSKQNPRKVIHMWAEKEMRNLLRMKEAKIACPDVVALKKHVLVMSFIGKDMLPAPKVKDVELPFEDMTIMYDQTIEIMRTMYSECKLVHADLSEYNLLWHQDQTWVIDVSQAVELTHPSAMEFLLRDCFNISTFFKKKGVLNVPNPEDLFFEICGQHPKKPDSKPQDAYPKKPSSVPLDQ